MTARTVDARGLFCPMPILQLAKALKPLQPGDEILLFATDPAVRADVPAWCDATGHTLVSLEERAGYVEARIRKSPA